MKKNALEILLVSLCIAAVSVFYFRGLPDVPFHPDESTQIFMSSDVMQFQHDPASLIWRPGAPLDARMRYRLLDAPLTRWMIGLGHILTGQKALAADWNWSRTWEENRAAGALPYPALLLSSRLAVAWLFPFSLALIYAIGRSLGGRVTAWAALALLASNPLVLLHTRRAMAESALLFFSLLSLFLMLRLQRAHGWIALTLALAINAKQSAAALLLPALFALLRAPGSRISRVKNLITFSIVGVLACVLLNPYVWRAPLGAVQAAWRARLTFTGEQTHFLSAAGYGFATQSFTDRLAGLLAQIFFLPPAVADVSNYAAEVNAVDYLVNPLHHLLRGTAGGGLLLGLALLGLALAGYHLVRGATHNRHALTILLLATLAQAGVLAGLFEIVFQRYYLTLVIFSALWAGYALQSGAALLGRLKWRGDRRGDSCRESRPS